MTTTIETQPKKIPDFQIFLQVGGENVRVGTVFKHGKGEGFNILIGNTRYVAFPAKAKSETTGKGA